MTASKQRGSARPVIKAPAPQRPKTLLQRLSSGIIHALPSFRASTPKNDLNTRPTTAPNAPWKRLRRGAIVAESGQQLTPQLEIITTDDPGQPSPYDSNSYHPPARLGKRRCSFCGMRGPKILQNEPYQACEAGGAGSHISSGGRLASTHRRHSAVDASHLARLTESTSSIDLGPRPVTPERAAKRIGNPPRVSRLPPGIIRLPAANTLQTPQNRILAARPPSRLTTRSPDDGIHNVSPQSPEISNTEELPKKPASPKLHHIHGLPNSENFPFVHKHEIPKHAIALRAGSASPLTDRSNSPRSSSGVRGPHDYSKTVYYGGKSSPYSASRAAAPEPKVTTILVKRAAMSGNAVVFDSQSSPLDVSLGNTQVYKKRSPQQTQLGASSKALVDNTDSGTTVSSHDTGSTRIGDMRLELKGGSPSSEGTPKLRGGSGHEGPSTNTFSFKLKRWLLTCHGPCTDDFDTDSDDDLPPARIVSPQRVAKMRQKMNERVPLPPHLCKRAPTVSPARDMRPGSEGLPPPTTFKTTISGPPRQSSSFRISSLSFPAMFHRRSESPIDQPVPAVTLQSSTAPFPHLRGGAASPDDIPPTLFWLAGGKGKPVSFSDWKQSRPKQRMGGLFGMAVFGKNYGTKYDNNINQEDEVNVSYSASTKVTANETPSVNLAKSSAYISSSSSSSSASVAAEHVKEMFVGADGESIGKAESIQRAITPLPNAPADDVPLCSGALPVEAAASPPPQDAGRTLASDGERGNTHNVSVTK